MQTESPAAVPAIDPREELARVRELLEIESAYCQLNAFRSARGLPQIERHGDRVVSFPLQEEASWPSFVDPTDGWYDDPSFGSGPIVNPISTYSDRQYGRFAPIYRNEQDLMWIRGRVHNLRVLAATTDGMQDALANFVLSKGMQFKVIEREKVGGLYGDIDLLVAAMQRVIDEFVDRHGFDGTGFDREAHHRSREDGEAFVPLEWDRRRNNVTASFVECEQVTQPGSPVEIDAWLGAANSNPNAWTFGVHSDVRRTWDVHGYHVIYDGRLGDWEYFPSDIVPDAMAREARGPGGTCVARMQHLKRNVTANAKRGVSDYYAVIGDIAQEAKVRRNSAHSAALQAAIAWILQTPPGTTQAQVQNIGAGDVFAQYQRPIMNGGTTKLQNVGRYPPGTILKPSPGTEYKPGPMGAERNAGFGEIGQYVLRMVGMRWGFPEGMVSGDWSNNNFASAMMAESPFVKAREADQGFYRTNFREILWKVLRMCWEMGRFDRFGVSWETIKHMVEIKVDLPAVATRDSLEMAQTAQLLQGIGVQAPRTTATQFGLDYDAEVKAGAKPADTTNPPPSGALPGPMKSDLKAQDGQPQPGHDPNAKPQPGAPQQRPQQHQPQPGQQSPQQRPPNGAPQPAKPQVVRRPIHEDSLTPAGRAALREAVLEETDADAIRALVLDACGNHP